MNGNKVHREDCNVAMHMSSLSLSNSYIVREKHDVMSMKISFKVQKDPGRPQTLAFTGIESLRATF